MRYYITSDIHGFFTPFIDSLTKAGWFEDTEPHKLIILGDLMDRGKEALKLQKFILELLEKKQVILIRGNHEDLFMQYVTLDKGIPYEHHLRNGTVDTAVQLTSQVSGGGWTYIGREEFVQACKQTPFYSTIIPSMIDFYETEHYVFVHGWVPCVHTALGNETIPDWRCASPKAWHNARWINGMEAAHLFTEEKIVFCGHWHASYGHSREGKGPEFGDGALFTPYYGKNVIAVDACTAYSGTVNCVVIDD